MEKRRFGSGSSCPTISGWRSTAANQATNFLTMKLAAVASPNSPAAPSDVVWVEDAVPSGATRAGDGEGWNWAGANPAPFSGALAHHSAAVAGMHQHYFYDASERLTVGTGDSLFEYVYLDPQNPPSEVMLQWHDDGGWGHRAYWGANVIPLGAEGTAGRYYAGPLLAAGQWVRLEVPAAAVGLEGRALNGMAFTLYGGRAARDRAGKSAPAAQGAPGP